MLPAMAVFNCAAGFVLAMIVFCKKKGLSKKVLVASMTAGNAVTLPYVLIPAVVDSMER